MKTFSISVLVSCFFLLSGSVCGSVQQEIEAANKAGQVAFIVVFDQASSQLDLARQIVLEAVKKTPGTVKVEMSRGDAANADLVRKYRLAGAPVPLILVMSTAGIVTGGQAASGMTADKLVGMIPTPKKTEAIQALSSGKSVLLMFFRKDMKSLGTVDSSCSTACKQMAGKCVQISIDMGDPKEARFVEEMKVDRASAEPVTLVANAQGQISGKYEGGVKASELVASATKQAAGCGPAGCGPSGCAPVK